MDSSTMDNSFCMRCNKFSPGVQKVPNRELIVCMDMCWSCRSDYFPTLLSILKQRYVWVEDKTLIHVCRRFLFLDLEIA